MELLASYADLAAALTTVSKAAKVSSVMPIVANVAMKTNSDRLYLKCNNLEFGIETYIVCDVIEQGEVTINANLLKNYILRLPKETISVHLKLNKKSLQLQIDVPGNEEEAVHINGIEISEFPQSPLNVTAHTITLQSCNLKSSINKVAYAAGTNEEFITTTSVRFMLTDGECSMAASDGTRLAYYMFNPLTTLPLDKKYQLLVPAKALVEIGSILPNTPDTIEVGPNSNNGYIIFKWNQFYCYINLIEGTYPKLENYINFDSETQILLSKKELEDKLTDISVLTKTEADIVEIDITHDDEEHAEGMLKLFASVEMLSDIKRQLFSSSVFGPNQKTMASIKLLRDAIKAIDSPDIMMEFHNSPMPQIVFGPYSDEYKKHISIVMPKYSN